MATTTTTATTKERTLLSTRPTTTTTNPREATPHHDCHLATAGKHHAPSTTGE